VGQVTRTKKNSKGKRKNEASKKGKQDNEYKNAQIK
jgi:hypothetical protein